MDEPSTKPTGSKHPYRRRMGVAALIQVALFLLASLTLDMGELGYAFLYAAAAFWTGATIIRLRRPLGPSRWDAYYLKYGLVILSLASALTVPAIWHLRGLALR